ncbi:hypothetical protein [Marinagarivorans cellulosilyticus]|uniref:Uncharacterized protein n=1 Tax=Marinagarivorans cellulosilyticus TaxID=2721545 RepID=A0AAN1WGH0_9GAMM|nr:hypothetical protein [Marinagarivorans cellulosilyticus]BCD97165.1 hypothetical protein MARGE09_P1366 [Marinagarivorans cellulosilyticus]
MEIKQNPFSVYDFLGYLTPGIIFIQCSSYYMSHIFKDNQNITAILNYTTPDSAKQYLPFVLASYVMGHILSLVSSWVIELYLIKRHGHASKYLLGQEIKGYFNSFDNNNFKKIRGLIFIVILFPISILDKILGDHLRMKFLYAKELDGLLQNIIIKKIEHVIKTHGKPDQEIEYNPDNQNYFAYIYHYTLENTNHHIQKFQNYVTLYGLLRNLTLIALLFFWLSAATFISDITNINLLYFTTFTGLLAFTLFVGYSKFMRRYTVEVLMAFATSYKTD